MQPGSPGIRDLDEKRKLSSEAPETGTLDGSFPRSPNTISEQETLKETARPLGNHVGVVAGAQQTKDQEESQRKKRRGALFWLLIALIALVILGIALGVGLGVGLTRNKSSPATYVYIEFT